MTSAATASAAMAASLSPSAPHHNRNHNHHNVSHNRRPNSGQHTPSFLKQHHHVDDRPVQSPLHRPAYGSPRIIQTLVQKGQEYAQRRTRALRQMRDPKPSPVLASSLRGGGGGVAAAYASGAAEAAAEAETAVAPQSQSEAQRQQENEANCQQPGSTSRLHGYSDETSPSGAPTANPHTAASTSPPSLTTKASEYVGSGTEASPVQVARNKLSSINTGSAFERPTRKASVSMTDSVEAAPSEPAPTSAAVNASLSSSVNGTSGQPQPTTTKSPPTTEMTDASPSHKRRASVGAEDGAAEQQKQREQPSIQKRPRPETAPPRVLPKRYEMCPEEDLVVLIADMINELIETNDPLALMSGSLTRFHSRTAPGISVLDYLRRLTRHATLNAPILLAMVFYIDRLCAYYSEFTMNTLTVHRFLITAATVAAKGLLDSYWTNATYARVGGVRPAELRLLELEFLYRVDWRIVPAHEVLVQYYNGLVTRHPGYVFEEAEEEEGEGQEGVEMDEEGEQEVQAAGGEPGGATSGRSASAEA